MPTTKDIWKINLKWDWKTHTVSMEIVIQLKKDEIIKIEEPLEGDLSFIPLLEDDERKRNKKEK